MPKSARFVSVWLIIERVWNIIWRTASFRAATFIGSASNVKHSSALTELSSTLVPAGLLRSQAFTGVASVLRCRNWFYKVVADLRAAQWHCNGCWCKFAKRPFEVNDKLLIFKRLLSTYFGSAVLNWMTNTHNTLSIKTSSSAQMVGQLQLTRLV